MTNRYEPTPSPSEGKVVCGHVIHNEPSTQAQRDAWYEAGYRRGCQDAYNYAEKHPGMPILFTIEADKLHRDGHLKGYNDYQLFRFGHIPKLEF